MRAGSEAHSPGLSGGPTDETAPTLELRLIPRLLQTPSWWLILINENLDFIAEIHGLARREKRERISAACREFRLEGLRRQRAGTMSGGQRQRIAIARSLALDPKFLIFDEPTSALDVSVQAQVLNLIRKLQRSKNLTYLFITHDLLVVKYIADRILVMYLGKLVESGPAEAVFEQPLHPYTQALLSAIPKADPHVRQERLLLEGEVPSPINPPIGCRFHSRCPLVESICREKEPELRRLGQRQVACHLA